MEAPGSVRSLAFRNQNGRMETLIRDGQFCEGIRESSSLSELGIQSGDTLAAATMTQSSPVRPKQAGKRKAPADEKAANTQVKKLLGANRSAVLLPDRSGPQSSDANTLAVQFINMESTGFAGLDGMAADMWVALRGRQRVAATERAAELVSVEKREAGDTTDTTLVVNFRPKRGAALIEETVHLLPKLTILDVFVGILERQGGSSRRRSAEGAKPSQRLLTLEAVSSRSPSIFWSIFYLADESGCPVGAYLDDLVTGALARYANVSSA